MDKPDIEEVKKYFLSLQNRLCEGLEKEDGKARCGRDEWRREEGGGGITRVIASGEVFEKGAVNFSHVLGERLPQAASAARPELANRHFQATGVSVVLHPVNPYVPTAHMNVRFFIAEHETEPPVWWFGGGFDLTPYYGFTADAVYWHRCAKEVCDRFGTEVYREFKERCDGYFYIRHRQETRGVGGIFFDDLNEWGFLRCFQFVREVGDGFEKAYLPIVSNRKDHSWGERERDFQLYRRGRYVEFNLVYDRGTLFGLQSGGRAESILVSMPPLARWEYDWKPDEGSPEEELCQVFLKPRDWINVPVS